MRETVVAEVRAEAIRQNLAAIRRRVGGHRPICVPVKANAYGHGLGQILPILAAAGVPQVAVANLDEALAVRSLGWNRPILCFGLLPSEADERTCRQAAGEAVAADVACTIASREHVGHLAAAARRLHRHAHIEIKIDTGMGRMGLMPEQAEQLIGEAARLPGVTIDGVYTHFASADDPDPAFTRQQLGRFVGCVERWRAGGLSIGAAHAANSAAVFRLPESHLDKVRPGLAVYGYCDWSAENRPVDLTPAMRVVSCLAAVRQLPPGHTVGYGRTFTTGRPSLIGVVPIGYADGYRRLLSNDAVMTLEPIRGQSRRHVPVIGRVSMDQTTVDLTDAGEVRTGDPVVVIDDDPAAANSVETLARKLDTIPYEVTCLISQRVRRMTV